jgi:amino acid transporter
MKRLWLHPGRPCYASGRSWLCALLLTYLPIAGSIRSVKIACICTDFLTAYLFLQLNTICIWWTGASVVVFLVSLLASADTKRSAKFVFTEYDASASGWPSGWAWFVGLLQAAYTLQGYGMVAAMCEEVQNPEKEVPKAMVLSVVAAAITVCLLFPIVFC